MKKILIICASEGKNLQLAQDALTEIKGQGAVAKMVNLCKLNLPLYNSSLDINELDLSITGLYDDIKDANGLFVIAPEYNGGVPPVLSNALCWLTRVDEDNWRLLFQEKMGAIATHSGGNGNNLVRSLTAQLEHIGMNIIGRKIITTYSKPLNQESLSNVVTQLIGLS